MTFFKKPLSRIELR